MDEIKKTPGISASRRALAYHIGLQLCAAAAGFMLGSVSFDGEIFPFGIAYTGGVSDRRLLASCIGTSLGALVFCGHTSALKYVCAAILLFVIRTACARLLTENTQLYARPLMTFFSVFACGLTVSLVFGGTGSSILLEFCDALIAGASALFSYRVSVLLTAGGIPFGVTAGDAAALMLWGGLLLLAFERFDIAGFSPARLIAFLLLMLLAYCGGETSGAIAGICCGILFGLSESNPQLLFALPAAGLLCGLCSEHGKPAVAGGFAAINTLALILRGNADTAVIAAAEYTAASLLFVFLPKRLTVFFTDVLTPFSRAGNSDCTRRRLDILSKRASKAVRDMAYTVEAVCRMLSRADRPDLHAIPADVKEDVCADCLKHDFCWKRAGPITEKAFGECLVRLENDGRLTPDQLPERLAIVCREKNALCDSFNRLLCEYNARLTVRSELFDAKALTAAQFRCAADIIDDAALRAVQSDDADRRLTAAAESTFTSFGFTYTHLLVSGAKTGRCVIEVFCTDVPAAADMNALLQRLETKTNIRFLPPVAEEYKNEGRLLTFCERTPLTVRYHKLSRRCDGEKLCGDSCETFHDGRGNFFCILSDGMGTGTRAALDSAMTASLFSRLMKAGFAPATAFGAANAALAVKSADETLATLDILKTDLYSGETDIYKAGASFTVLRSSGSVSFIEHSSMPLGILKDTHFEHTALKLKKGDTVIMTSDGANALGMSFYKELFASHGKAYPNELCRLVVEAAAAATPSGRSDDITAVCIQLL